MTGGAAAGVAGAIASSALSGAVIGAGSGAVIGGISSVANGGSFAEGASDGFMWGALGGAVTGGTTGALGSTAVTGTQSALNNPLAKNVVENAVDTAFGTVDDLAHGRDVSLGSIATDFGVGMLMSGRGTSKAPDANDVEVPIINTKSDPPLLVDKRAGQLALPDKNAGQLALPDKGNIVKADSTKLRKNLIKAGDEVPEYRNAAHHIVAGNAKLAEESRAVLNNYGIDINDSVNGVFLPTEKGVSNSAYQH